MDSLHYAWRNIWRNKRRTFITLSAVCLATAIMIVSYALMDGLFRQAVDNVTNLIVGEVQVHARGFLTDRSMYKSIRDPQALLRMADKKRIGAAPRSIGFGLVARTTKSAGAMIWGVDPGRERSAFDLAKHVVRGRYLASAPKKEMVLGRKLARSLGAKVGSEIVVVVQAADGSMGNELYKVVGIFKTAGDNIDRAGAFIHARDFSELFVSGGRVHEVALNSRGRLKPVVIKILAEGVAPRADVKTWGQLMPAMNDMMAMLDAFLALFGLIFVFAAALGVMNTMLMATKERVREFGIMIAAGATRWRIIRDVCAETLVLVAVATALGTAIGVAGGWYFAVYGLDTSMFAGQYSVGGVAFDPVWRAALSVKSIVVSVVMMFIVCVIASLYPALVAARLDPVKAINRV